MFLSLCIQCSDNSRKEYQCNCKGWISRERRQTPEAVTSAGKIIQFTVSGSDR